MSYQVLARKWRPRTFAALTGQDMVVRALTQALMQGRLHHAYLFTGTRGVGKTTLARILAKALNCETGITATPCGICSACVDIDGGRFPDMLEVDAATNSKVDEMRSLLENSVYVPSRGRFKIYVIDEVHMLSNSAFNAMLKTLEEPPEHLKFILATTDPQKIPVTVLSRCLQFSLRRIAPEAIATQLAHILKEEGIETEEAALPFIAKAAAGSMRDALSILDQAIAVSPSKITAANVRQMLGVAGDDALYAILDALIAEDAQALMQTAEDLAQQALSFDALLRDLASLFLKLAASQLAPHSFPEEVKLQPYAQKIDREYLQLAYQIVLHGRRDLALAPDEQAGFTMTLLRLFAFRPDRIRTSTTEGEKQSSSPIRAETHEKVAPNPEEYRAPEARASTEAPWNTPFPVGEKQSSSPMRAETHEKVAPNRENYRATQARNSTEAPWNPPSPAEGISPYRPTSHRYDPSPIAAHEPLPNDVPWMSDTDMAKAQTKVQPKVQPATPTTAEAWHTLARTDSLPAPLKEFARHCAWVRSSDTLIELQIDPDHQSLLDTNAPRELQTALQKILGMEIKVAVGSGAANQLVDTLASRQKESVASDPFICKIKEQFSTPQDPVDVRFWGGG